MVKQTARAYLPPAADQSANWLAAWYPVVGMSALIVGAMAGLILWLNMGTFTYALDDPYIHLALAQNIASGQYGINPGEAAAPSSSVIWPLVLAPFAATPFGDFIPLIINIVAAGVVLALLCQLVTGGYTALAQPAQCYATTISVLIISVIINLFGLVFTGMEHTVQIALSLAILLGLLAMHKDGRLRWWLAAALIAAPLVRYECLGLSGAALVYMLWRRQIAATALIGSILVAILGGFSLFLIAHGLGPLPSSIIAKSTGASTTLSALVSNRLLAIVTSTQGWCLLIGLVGLATSGERSLRPLGRCVAAATLGHLLFGRVGGYPRYENYLVALVLVAGMLLYQPQLTRFVSRQRRATLLMGAIVLPIVLAPTSLLAQFGTPLGSNNVYEQQYQMSRFVAEYWRAPIAVNDLGLVARRGNQYTLDLWGLGSHEALALRQGPIADALWLDTLTRMHGVELVMIYPERFDSIPAMWQPLGDLQLSRPAATVAGSNVRFYATTATAAKRAAPLLHLFAQQLPIGATFVVAQE